MKSQNGLINFIILMSICYTAMGFAIKPQPTHFKFSLTDLSMISISGTTNVKKFNCISRQVFPEMQAEYYKIDQADSLRFNNAALDLNVNSLDCGNKEMNRDLMKILDAKHYPVIHIHLLSAKALASLDNKNNSSVPVNATLEIIIDGKAKQKNVRINVARQNNQQLHAQGATDLYLSDFGICSPTALLGMVKIRDKITVKLDLYIQYNNKNI